eukprot:519648-Amphidinium_carterae.1
MHGCLEAGMDDGELVERGRLCSGAGSLLTSGYSLGNLLTCTKVTTQETVQAPFNTTSGSNCHSSKLVSQPQTDSFWQLKC